ncbi:MAG: ribose-5-phosphate isomerase RpiA [Rubricella sp.]
MTDRHNPSDIAKIVSARAALAEVADGMKLGLGTGSTAEWFVKLLALHMRNTGIEVICVPTSDRTGALAEKLGIPLATLGDLGQLDLTVDGADEFDPALDLIKGGGAAHLREKIVACASERMIVISDASKQVQALGAFPLPVEVIGFGNRATHGHIASALAAEGLGGRPIRLRERGGQPVFTDEGNLVFDLHLGRIGNAPALAARLSAIPGVVEHGLFCGIAAAVSIGHPDGRAEWLERGHAARPVTFADTLGGDPVPAALATL